MTRRVETISRLILEERTLSKEATIAQAKKLRQEDQLEESQELLLELLYDHPDDPLVLYEVGGSYDVLGEEPEAIPYYQQAIAAGLAGDDLQECWYAWVAVSVMWASQKKR